jgi:hypothetical protein
MTNNQISSPVCSNRNGNPNNGNGEGLLSLRSLVGASTTAARSASLLYYGRISGVTAGGVASFQDEVNTSKSSRIELILDAIDSVLEILEAYDDDSVLFLDANRSSQQRRRP